MRGIPNPPQLGADQHATHHVANLGGVSGVDLATLPDNTLVAMAGAGDHEAFGVLVTRHSARIHGLALGMMHNTADAQDVVQDTFLNAYRKLDGFRGDAAFSSWLYRIATNSCLMKMRTRRRRPEVSLEVEESRPIEPTDGKRLDVEFEHRELGRTILECAERLPDNYRDVFILADLQERSMKEIADELDLTVPNVKTRLHRARRRLRTYLSELLDLEPSLVPT